MLSEEAREVQEPKQAFSQYENGEVEVLSGRQGVTFCGVAIALPSLRVASLSRGNYYPEITPLYSTKMMRQGVIITPICKLSRKSNAFVGSSFWKIQTRFGLSYPICSRASLLVSALRCHKRLSVFRKDPSKLLSLITAGHLPPTFHNFMGSSHMQRFPRLFSLTDASHGAIENGGIVESECVIYGIPLSRGGAVLSRVHLIAW